MAFVFQHLAFVEDVVVGVQSLVGEVALQTQRAEVNHESFLDVDVDFHVLVAERHNAELVLPRSAVRHLKMAVRRRSYKLSAVGQQHVGISHRCAGYGVNQSALHPGGRCGRQ